MLAGEGLPLKEHILHRRFEPVTIDHDKEAKRLLLLNEEDVSLRQVLDNFPNTTGAFSILRLHRLTHFELSDQLADFVEAVMAKCRSVSVEMYCIH